MREKDEIGYFITLVSPLGKSRGVGETLICFLDSPHMVSYYLPIHFVANAILNYKIYLFGVLRCFQHCTGHITMGSWKGRGNQYIEFTRVVYCKLPTNGKQLPAFPLEPVRGSNPSLRGGRRECYFKLSG